MKRINFCGGSEEYCVIISEGEVYHVPPHTSLSFIDMDSLKQQAPLSPSEVLDLAMEGILLDPYPIMEGVLNWNVSELEALNIGIEWFLKQEEIPSEGWRLENSQYIKLTAGDGTTGYLKYWEEVKWNYNERIFELSENHYESLSEYEYLQAYEEALRSPEWTPECQYEFHLAA